MCSWKHTSCEPRIFEQLIGFAGDCSAAVVEIGGIHAFLFVESTRVILKSCGVFGVIVGGLWSPSLDVLADVIALVEGGWAGIRRSLF